jgi:fibronectin-binding autotransporter adhesin
MCMADLAFALGTPNVVGSGVNDLVVVNGNLTLDGALDVTELAGFGSGNYRLFNYTGSLTNGGVQFSGAGQYYLDLSVANQVSLVVLPVPEPTTGLLLLSGLCLFARRKRAKC